MTGLQMVDLRGQYLAIKDEVDAALQGVIESTAFIRGPEVGHFERELAAYLGGTYALGVANGTDALQLAFMALGLGPGDEVITSPFTFIATAEAAALLGARPVFVDIDPRTFNLDPSAVEAAITPRTRAIVPVHLFGQAADMDAIRAVASRYGLPVVEDNAQSIGSEYHGQKAGYLGQIGCLSFFPSKNLGAYGDGGAVLTNDEGLHQQLRMLANHGARRKYYHEVVGINSRLDALHAAVLRVKLRHLDAYTRARQDAADRYDALLADCPGVTVPWRDPKGTHVFHQYTIRVPAGARPALEAHLKEHGVPYAIYYPVPLHRLPVFAGADGAPAAHLPEADRAAAEVISLPMHTELTPEQQAYIADTVRTGIEQATLA